MTEVKPLPPPLPLPPPGKKTERTILHELERVEMDRLARELERQRPR